MAFLGALVLSCLLTPPNKRKGNKIAGKNFELREKTGPTTRRGAFPEPNPLLVRAPVNFPRPGSLASFSLTFFSKLPSKKEAGSVWPTALGDPL